VFRPKVQIIGRQCLLLSASSSAESTDILLSLPRSPNFLPKAQLDHNTPSVAKLLRQYALLALKSAATPPPWSRSLTPPGRRSWPVCSTDDDPHCDSADFLPAECRKHRLPAPVFNILSDRRGMSCQTRSKQERFLRPCIVEAIADYSFRRAHCLDLDSHHPGAQHSSPQLVRRAVHQQCQRRRRRSRSHQNAQPLPDDPELAIFWTPQHCRLGPLSMRHRPRHANRSLTCLDMNAWKRTCWRMFRVCSAGPPHVLNGDWKHCSA
jgi:hypothetical protein